jgi:hypothetical protein
MDYHTPRHCQAVELLLGYLQVPGALLWPGADGITVAEVLRAYSEAAASGRVPTRRELLVRRPDLAEELKHLVPWWSGVEHRPEHES